jgi:hypothetical protein
VSVSFALGFFPPGYRSSTVYIKFKVAGLEPSGDSKAILPPDPRVECASDARKVEGEIH